ncbi:MAG: AsmA family protein [Acidobacteriaceae bacterium]
MSILSSTGDAEQLQKAEAGQGRGWARRARRILITAAVVVLVIVLVPLINLGRYHRTIADSLARALGHSVTLGRVNLTLFPLPGLVIHDLEVEEEPAFGAEPLLKSPEVTVYPRLSSLWRERLEIARIDLDNASVNLARDAAGRWNFSSLLLQASRTATRPTSQRRPSATPRFPYIEFSDARINFKIGEEKKAFSFMNADASVWLADADQWRIRFEAQPARTDLDLDLEDMGTVKVNGSLTRAESLEQLPLKLHLDWTGAQLGQASRLLFGEDSGWRGDLHAQADVTGNVDDLAMKTRLRVEDAHRLEFTPMNHFNIDTKCAAEYDHAARSVNNLTCLWPTGSGHLLLTGSVADLAHPKPNLRLEINHTPIRFAVDLLGLMRRGLPALVDASGTINGAFAWGSPEGASGAPAQNVLSGHAVADTVALRLANVDRPITFAALRLATPSDIGVVAPLRRKRRGNKTAAPVAPAGNVVVLEPASFAAGSATPMQVAGRFSRTGFSLHFTGESSVARLIPVAQDFHQISALDALQAKGTAQTDLTFAGPWIPAVDVDTGASVETPAEGWVRLQHAELKPAWLKQPIEVASATAEVGGGTVTWANASASIKGLAAKGSVSYPATCANPAGCAAQVNLNFAALNAGTLEKTLLGDGQHGVLAAILSRVESPAPGWPAMDGTVHADVLTIGKLRLKNASAAIAVADHRLRIASLDASALGGSAHATGLVEAAQDGPHYTLDVTWTGVKLAQAGSLFGEDWGTGTVDGNAKLKLHGAANLAASATGNFEWLVNGRWGGSWKPGAAERQGRRSQWAAAGTVARGTLRLTKGPARGTIGFDRKLSLEWVETGAKALVPLRGVAAPFKPCPDTKLAGSGCGGASKRASGEKEVSLLHVTGTLGHPVAVSAKRPGVEQSEN